MTTNTAFSGNPRAVGAGAFQKPPVGPSIESPLGPPLGPVARAARRCWAALGAVGLAWALAACSATEPAPQSEVVLLDGTRLSTAQLRGKVVLVNFWATSCVSCVREMPELVATHQKFQAQGFETLAIAMSYDPPAYVVNFAQTRQLPFKVALDNTGAAAKAWGDVQVTPTTFVVNRQGQIVKRFIGEPDFAQLHRLLADLLAQPA